MQPAIPDGTGGGVRPGAEQAQSSGGKAPKAHNPGVYDKPKLGASRTCTASNFGGPNDSSVGSHTANGEAFDWHQNLVAHRTLPFGSEVSVTYKGKTITGVPVKDNGPSSTKAGDVCIDLSYGLYEQLAKPGTGHIVVTWKVTKLNGKHRKMVV